MAVPVACLPDGELSPPPRLLRPRTAPSPRYEHGGNILGMGGLQLARRVVRAHRRSLDAREPRMGERRKHVRQGRRRLHKNKYGLPVEQAGRRNKEDREVRHFENQWIDNAIQFDFFVYICKNKITYARISVGLHNLLCWQPC